MLVTLMPGITISSWLGPGSPSPPPPPPSFLSELFSPQATGDVKAAPTPTPSPVFLGHRPAPVEEVADNNQNQKHQEVEEEQDYGYWNTLPYDNGGYAAPIPHSEVSN